jgi:dolichol-phosphate mannosyltransferase
MSPAIVLEATARVTAWGFRSRFGRRDAAQPANGDRGSSSAGRSRA